jgi:2-polyprenyl-3-methyl-5-hydroxy-6-metoxy-1,4-benzoquinol methylase
MSNNVPADKSKEQAQGDTQIEKVKEPAPAQNSNAEKPSANPVQGSAVQQPAKPALEQPAPAVPPAKQMPEPPVTDKTVVHVEPVVASATPATPAAPATPQPESAGASPAADTLPRKPSSSTELPKVTAPTIPPTAQALPDIENPYILSGEVDRARLVAQARLFRGYIEANAKRLIGENVKSILDIGCGEGQITQVFARLYPEAHVVGLDSDEKAVETARRAARGITNLEYVVADAQESLLTGPFDVVYESMSLLHMRNPAQVIQLAFQVLKPGGLLWLKEGDARGFMTAFTHPAYRRLVDLLVSSMAKMGGDASVAMKLPEMLGKVGFADVKVEPETYPIGNTSTEARITMVSQIGVLYNARHMISKVQNIPVSEVETMYRALLDSLMAPDGPTGQWPFMNIIARRPAQSVAVTTEPPKAAAPTTVPATAQPLPDIENPYILSGEVDRARLVAQTRLFRGYIEANAKRLIGENIKSVLDIGCGEGQLTLVFAKLYPGARIVGVDRDEKAIEVARRAAKGLPNVEFEVADIQERLPAGPFDLIFESIVLMHVPNTGKVLKLVYDALKPEGYLWCKDLHASIETAVPHPAYDRLGGWMGLTMDRIGAHWRIGAEMPDILTAAGFTNLKVEREVQTLGTRTPDERITMAVNLGALYNARKLITRVLQVPEAEIEKAYKEVLDAMMAPGGPRGDYVYMHTVAQRPATTA